MKVRKLASDDDPSAFSCGDPDLDRFFHKYAGQNQFAKHIGVTYVAEVDGQIVAYATVAASSMQIDDLPEKRRKGLPRYPLPILRLGRLAVDEKYGQRGYGSELLRHVFVLAVEMTSTTGCIGILVDAYPEAVAFYSQYGLEKIDLVEGSSGSRPRPVAMYIAIDEIIAAVAAQGVVVG
jgi:GNAT superfamily N-acetyltransferase